MHRPYPRSLGLLTGSVRDDSVRDLDQAPGVRYRRRVVSRFAAQVVHAVPEGATGTGLDPPHVLLVIQRRRATGGRPALVAVQCWGGRGRPPLAALPPVPEDGPDHVEPPTPEKRHRCVVRLTGHPHLN